MSAKGSKLPRHRVECLECGAALVLATYWRKPKCKACREKVKKPKHERTRRRLQQEARRYRIIRDLMGYRDDQWEYMLVDLKESGLAENRTPQTLGAAWDLRHEEAANDDREQ